MKSRGHNVVENRLTNIPIDLSIEIFSRLPAKSIARCRCVSKLWTSILHSSDFTEVFLTKSSSRPQLLFACHFNDELLFFSATQPHNPDENSFPLAASYLLKIPFAGLSQRFISPIRGLVFIRDVQDLKGRTWICNPSTGQFLTLPKVSTGIFWVGSYIGYDPIEKQFKVLAMTSTVYGRREVVSEEYQVLTLETREPSWRKIECCIPHYPLHKCICIDGVLYYPAAIDMRSRCSMIVCFDVSSEKFRSVRVTEAFVEAACYEILINYNGKLAALGSRVCFVNGLTGSFKLWVLEDVEKEEWSEHTYVLSASCRNAFRNICLRFVGVTRTNEIVLSPYYQNQTGLFYVFYYNMERNTVVKVEIQGMEACKGNKVFTYLDHVEDVKLMQMF